MIEEERGKKEKEEWKIGKVIFPKGRGEIGLKVFDFQMRRKNPAHDQEEEDEG
jgi:hypothetical protein